MSESVSQSGSPGYTVRYLELRSKDEETAAEEADDAAAVGLDVWPEGVLKRSEVPSEEIQRICLEIDGKDDAEDALMNAALRSSIGVGEAPEPPPPQASLCEEWMRNSLDGDGVLLRRSQLNQGQMIKKQRRDDNCHRWETSY